jgi:hypothetical protein
MPSRHNSSITIEELLKQYDDVEHVDGSPLEHQGTGFEIPLLEVSATAQTIIDQFTYDIPGWEKALKKLTGEVYKFNKNKISAEKNAVGFLFQAVGDYKHKPFIAIIATYLPEKDLYKINFTAIDQNLKGVVKDELDDMFADHLVDDLHWLNQYKGHDFIGKEA